MDDGDLPSFVSLLQREHGCCPTHPLKFQIALIERTAATLKDRAAFLEALLDLDPAVLHTPVQSSSAHHSQRNLQSLYPRVHIRAGPSASTTDADLAHT